MLTYYLFQLKGHETFLPAYDKIGLNGPGKFVSFGKELPTAAPILSDLIRDSFDDYSTIKLFIPFTLQLRRFI